VTAAVLAPASGAGMPAETAVVRAAERAQWRVWLQAVAASAADHFDGFSRSVRRVILEWIAKAKRAETRQRRIALAVDCAARNVPPPPWARSTGGDRRP